MKYSRAMVHAFADVTGRTIQEALTDLGLSDTVPEDGPDKLTGNEGTCLMKVLLAEAPVKKNQKR